MLEKLKKISQSELQFTFCVFSYQARFFFYDVDLRVNLVGIF